MADRPLENRVIVIVGGTTGLGLSAARACLAAGGKVVAVGRDLENVRAAAKVFGSEGRALNGDARRPETASRAIEEAVRAFGGFHALYHVAGGSGRSLGDGPLHTITDGGWNETIDMNLTSLFYSSRAAARHLVERKTGGSILLMGSVLGAWPSAHHFATHAYAAAKSAVIGFTKALAAYYAPQGIRFNAIAPALVDTAMARRAAGDPEILEYIAGKQPLDGGRIGRPEDLDAAVVFFLSDQSRYVTGQVLAVDGGWSVSEGTAPGGD